MEERFEMMRTHLVLISAIDEADVGTVPETDHELVLHESWDQIATFYTEDPPTKAEVSATVKKAVRR